MSSAYREAIKEAYATAQNDIAILETIEINHTSLPEPIRLVANQVDIQAGVAGGTVETFTASSFKFDMPAAGKNGHQKLTLSIDNIDKRISQFVTSARLLNETVSVIYRPYISSDLTYPQMDPPLHLSLSKVRMNNYKVVADAVFADVLNKKFLSELYTRNRFPSLGN